MVITRVSREVNHTYHIWDILLKLAVISTYFRFFKGFFSCVNESAGIFVFSEKKIQFRKA